MQIGAVSEAVSSSTQWNSVQPVSKSAAISPLAAASASVQPQASASSAQRTIAEAYSTTVGGKSYSASVEESGGVYTASVPMPPGLRATGGSIQSAEINLSIVLDTLA